MFLLLFFNKFLSAIINIVDRVSVEKTRNEFLRDFVYFHARCNISLIANEQTTHDALLKFIPILVIYFILFYLFVFVSTIIIKFKTK